MVFKEMISISDVNFGKIPSRQRISGKDSFQTCICPKNPLWNEQFGKYLVQKKIFREKLVPLDICPNCSSERMVFKEMISISDVNFGKIPLRQRISGKDSIQTCICPKNPLWNEQFGKISCVEKEFQRKTFSTRYLSQLPFGKDGI